MGLEDSESRLGSVDQGTKVGLQDAGILSGRLLQGPFEVLMDLEEGLPSRRRALAAEEKRIEMLPGFFPQVGALGRLEAPQKAEEANGLGEVEPCGRDRERRGHLLLGG